jgi:hypothetical protein
MACIGVLADEVEFTRNGLEYDNEMSRERRSSGK